MGQGAHGGENLRFLQGGSGFKDQVKMTGTGRKVKRIGEQKKYIINERM